MSVVERFPADMREDVVAVLTKLGPPELLYVMTQTDRLFGRPSADLMDILGMASVYTYEADRDDDAPPETYWVDNIMDFLMDRMTPEDCVPSHLDTYKPDLRRPDAMDHLLEVVMGTARGMIVDGGAYAIEGRPGAALVRVSDYLRGGWAVEVDIPERPGGMPGADLVRGMWEVDLEGEFTGRFVANPGYCPSRFASSVLAWFPPRVRSAVAWAAFHARDWQVFDLLHYGRWLLGEQRERLQAILDEAAVRLEDPVHAAWMAMTAGYLRDHWPGDGEPLEPHGYYGPEWVPPLDEPGSGLLDALAVLAPVRDGEDADAASRPGEDDLTIDLGAVLEGR